MTITSSPRVSVIIPTYNRATMLPRAVKSVLAQTYTDLELLIVDDCSADETPEVVAGFVDPRIRSFRHSRNRGLAATRNTGIANSRGEYIAFLDDDDEFLPTKIEKQVNVLDSASPEVGMVYAWWNTVGPTGAVEYAGRPTAQGCVFEQALALRLSLGIGSTAMFRASAVDATGRFDERIARSEDLDFLCRLTKEYNIAVVHQVLVKLHIGHLRMTTSTRSHLEKWRNSVLYHMEKHRADLHGRRAVRAMLWWRVAQLAWRSCDYPATVKAVVHSSLNNPRTVWYVAKWMTKRAFARSGGASSSTKSDALS